MKRNRVVVVVALAMLACVVVWLRSEAPLTPADAAGARGDAVPTSEDRVEVLATPLDVTRAPVGEIEDASETSDAARTALTPPPADVSEPRITLFGVLRPDPSRAALEESNTAIAITEEFGERLLARSNELGEFSMSGLRPGRYYIFVNSPLDGQAQDEVELVADEDARRVDLQLKLRPEVWVKLVDPTGAPLVTRARLLAIATLEAPGDWFHDVRGSLNNPFGVGHWWQNGFASPRRGEEYLGRLILDVEPPVFVSLLNFQRVVATRRVDRGVKEVIFELEPDAPLLQPGALRVRFVRADNGTPLAGASFNLSNSGLRPGTLDADGVLAAERLAPGWCTVRIRATDLENGELRVIVEPGVTTELGEIALEAAREISGQVVDESGQGLPKADVHYAALDEATLEPLPDDGGYLTRTDAQGHFKIGGLSSRLYQLDCILNESKRARSSRIVDLRRGSAEDVRIEAPTGTPVVLSSHGEAWRDVRFEVLDEQGQRVLRSKLWSSQPWPVYLAPGRYTFVVRGRDSEEQARHEVQVGDAPVLLRLP